MYDKTIYLYYELESVASRLLIISGKLLHATAEYRV